MEGVDDPHRLPSSMPCRRTQAPSPLLEYFQFRAHRSCLDAISGGTDILGLCFSSSRVAALNLTEKCDTSQATLSSFNWLGDQYSLPARAED